MSSIFHAFNIPYKIIASLAPHLQEIGFTHVQFPPIQTARTLTELDAALLLSMLRSKDIHVQNYKTKRTQALQKDNLYPPHNFHYLLDQTIDYIQQPTLKQQYSGTIVDNPTYHFLATVFQTGQTHPYYPLIEAAKCVLQWQPLIPFSSEKLNKLQEIRKTIQPLLKATRTQELIQKECQFKKEISQELSKQTVWQKQIDIRQTLQRLVPVTTKLRQHLLSQGIPTVTNIPIIPTKKMKQFEDIVFICEALLYPPWWIVYQPLALEIGQTPLGSKEDILRAIQSCRQSGLFVITDVVVNNLAAVAGEKASWETVRQKALEQNAVLLSDIHMDTANIEAIHIVQKLLENAFESNDLSLLTAPYECREGQDPTRCWMSGCLPQLNPAHSLVIKNQQRFLETLLDAGVDGIRVDAAAHLTPPHCEWLLSFFPGISYIEYVGSNGDMYTVRKEDFAIGEDIVGSIFSEKGYLQKTTNYGDHRLRRLEDLDSVTMIINHDQMMGTIPSAVVENLPSQATYSLSLAYLIQRVYGIPLVLPHDIERRFVLDALQLRKRMKDVGIVREYVTIAENCIRIDKYDIHDNIRFIVYINMNETMKEVPEGVLDPLSFQWFYVQTTNVRLVYNDHQNKILKRCYTRSNKTVNFRKRNTTRKVHK